MKVLLIFLLPCLVWGQYDIKRILPSSASFYMAGMASGVADICSTPAKYNESAFKRWNPEFTYGEYLGHKDETWVNKWNMESDGVHVGHERFIGSSTFLVGATDIWHGSRVVMLVGFKGGVLMYKRGDKWWHYALDFVILSAAYSAGWWTADLTLR